MWSKILCAWYIVVDFAIISKHAIPFLIDYGSCPLLYVYVIVLCVKDKFLLVLLLRLHRCAYSILLGLLLRTFGPNQNAGPKAVFSNFS